MLISLEFCYSIRKRALALENCKVKRKPLKEHQGQDRGNRGHGLGVIPGKFEEQEKIPEAISFSRLKLSSFVSCVCVFYRP